jgi:ADP-ribose pyrophosphatase
LTDDARTPMTIDPRGMYQELLRSHPILTREGGAGSIELLLEDEQIKAAEEAARARLRANQPESWASVGVAYEDPYLYLLRDAVRFPPDQEGMRPSLGTYIRIHQKPFGRSGVAILCVHEGQIVLEDHFRHATRSWHWEIPRGVIEENETCEKAASRELKEEFGVRAITMQPLGD